MKISLKLLIPRELWSLELELEWLLMKSCEFHLPIPLLLVEILIFKDSHIQYLTFFVKCTLALIYNEFSQSVNTQ